MKIKQVCELTGLTDRAIRFYIEEGLVAPRYTENYLGRKSFEFSQEDVEQLCGIATLRKFGFTVKELKQLHEDPTQSSRMIEQIRVRKAVAITEEQKTLALLEKIGHYSSYSIRQMAASLKEVAEAQEPPRMLSDEASQKKLGKIIAWIACILFIGSYIFELGDTLLLYIREQRYSAFDWHTVVHLLFFPALVAIVVFVEWLVYRIFHLSNGARKISSIIIVYAICIPALYLFDIVPEIFGPAVTTNIRHYRKIDVSTQAMTDRFYQQLFPMGFNTKTVYAREEGASYRYWADFDSGPTYYDIYASWFMEAEDFPAEVERVTALFDSYTQNDFYNYTVSEQGDFTILALHEADDGLVQLFAPGTWGYNYYLFACNASTFEVRYAAGYCIQQGQVPYYFSLNWESPEK